MIIYGGWDRERSFADMVCFDFGKLPSISAFFSFFYYHYFHYAFAVIVADYCFIIILLVYIMLFMIVIVIIIIKFLLASNINNMMFILIVIIMVIQIVVIFVSHRNQSVDGAPQFSSAETTRAWHPTPQRGGVSKCDAGVWRHH